MDVVCYTTLTPGFCGKRGRCYNKDCKNQTICCIGFKLKFKDTRDNEAINTEVHRQWE